MQYIMIYYHLKALAMVEEECRRYRPTKNYLENAGPELNTVFETAALQREMERVQQRLPMEPLSMKRYLYYLLFRFNLLRFKLSNV